MDMRGTLTIDESGLGISGLNTFADPYAAN